MTENTVTTQPVKSTPKDVFLHLLLIITLYMGVVSFIVLLFQYVNILLPDALQPYYVNNYDGIRWGSSVLLVVIPVFLFLSRWLEKEFAVAPEKRAFKIRRWLIYFTLFLAALTIIIDLITLVYNFYNGELTTRFFVKTVIVLVVPAVVFWYYQWDLKRQNEVSKVPRYMAWGVAVVLIVSLVAGFFIGGSPAQQRRVRFDAQRVNDLQVIQSQILNYWQQKHQLPTDLTQLSDSISGFGAPGDPATLQSYEYSKKSDLVFSLCADFETALLANANAAKVVPLYQDNWNHSAGHVCFDRTIDPQLYGPTPK